MREIRVHLHDAVPPFGQRLGEGMHVGGAQAGLLCPVQHANLVVARGYLVGQIARPVRRVVVNYLNRRLRHGSPHSGNDRFDAFAFVVGWNDDECSWQNGLATGALDLGCAAGERGSHVGLVRPYHHFDEFAEPHARFPA